MPALWRPGAWNELWLDRRDRLLANPRFQQWAARFPLTRWISRRKARALFDLCAGFVYSQVLLACVRLGLLEALAEAPQSASEIAVRLRLDEDRAQRLLSAAAALRLVSRRSRGRYGLGELGAALLGNPAVRLLIEHHALLYADLADPVALLRGGPAETCLARYWPYVDAARPADLAAADVAPYTALMAASQSFIAGEVLGAYPVRRHRHLLDVGGGEGAFAAAAARAAPRLRLTVFDLPAVVERARMRLLAMGCAERVRTVGGDFFSDPLPEGADLATLIRVVHDHDDAQALSLLTALRSVLAPGGTLLIAEPFAQTPRVEPVADAYFGFYFLAMGRGRPRSFAALSALLHRAGFDRVVQHATRMPLYVQVVTARARC
jgi:demethylspheroidene O-methyltransferase